MFNPPLLEKMLLSVDSDLHCALAVIDENGQGVCFIVDGTQFIGLLTDGDIRRLMLRKVSLDSPVSGHVNKLVSTLPYGADNELIQKTLSEKVRHIPLLDGNGNLVDYACRRRYRNIPLAEPVLEGNELAYITDCIDTNWISSQGRYVSRFEEMFIEYIGTKEALAVCNGTVALHLALEALGIGSGDEVIVPDFTFAATANAVIYTGAVPVLADIDEETWTIDVASIEEMITPKTRAIIPVHIYGHPCDMEPLLNIARSHNLFIIEDCAEALGTKYKNRLVGCFGDAAIFSFFGNKTITTGEGGMVLFRDKEIANHARTLRDHGMNRQRRYWHDIVGFNYRMTNLQAAVGVAQMERISYFIDKKRELAVAYNERLSSLDELKLPVEMEWATNSYWLYTVLLQRDCGLNRDDLLRSFQNSGIEARPTFQPLSIMPPYKGFSKAESSKHAEYVAEYGISLPSSINTNINQIDAVVRVIKNFIREA